MMKLKIFVDSPSNSDAEEIEPGIFVRRDENNSVKSVGIFSFKKRSIPINDILKKVNLIFPLKISI